MNYIGSKLSLLGFLEESINKVVDKNCRIFCDLFAGTGIVGSYFKLKKTAQKPFVLKPAEIIINDQKHRVFNEDINELASKIKGDILYLDPPYNHRQYATNYHLLETVAKYDNPKIHGKTGLREYKSQKSFYCSRTKVKKAFRDLILAARTNYIFLSYNNEGLMTLDDIKKIMSLRGKYGYFTKEYNRLKADRDENRDYSANKTVEYLQYVVCK